MFRAMISTILRRTRLCLQLVVLCNHDIAGRYHRVCILPQAVKQSSFPEDGRNLRLKHVELIGIINKLLLLHLGTVVAQ
jgi:hypothetical protein